MLVVVDQVDIGSSEPWDSVPHTGTRVNEHRRDRPGRVTRGSFGGTHTPPRPCSRRQEPETWDVRGIFTTVTPAFDRVSVHGTPLGENGEFHTCVVDGPMFSSPVPARPGRIVKRPVSTDGSGDEEMAGPVCVYADLVRV